MKSVAVFEEFWIPVHVNDIEELHDTFPADPKDSCQRRKAFSFTCSGSQKQATAYESNEFSMSLSISLATGHLTNLTSPNSDNKVGYKSFWSFTIVNLKSTLSVIVERSLKLWCPTSRVHFGEFSLSKASKEIP